MRIVAALLAIVLAQEGKGLLDAGSEAPDFETTDLDGKAVKLSDFKGKTVLVNFWFYG